MGNESDALIREVQEELRRDKLKKFWDQYGTYAIGALVLVLAGVGGLTQMLAPGDMRARLLSVSSMLSTGIQPIGALLVGWLGNALGPLLAIRVNGSMIMMIALSLLFLHKEYRNWTVERH